MNLRPAVFQSSIVLSPIAGRVMSRRNHRQWLFSAIVIVTIFFSITLSVFLRSPMLVSVQPAQAGPGETIVLEGRFLGRHDARSTLKGGKSADNILTYSGMGVLLESPFRVPDGMRSGDVFAYSQSERE